MSEKKILFTDLDGTLLSDDGTVSQENKTAMQQALKQGHRIALATGRPLCSARKAVKELGVASSISYILAFQGSVLYDCAADRVLYGFTIPLPFVDRLFDAAKGAGIYIQTYDQSHVLTRSAAKELAYYTRKTGMAYRLLPPEGPVSDAVKEAPNKALLIDLAGGQALEQFQKEQEHWTKDGMHAFFSCREYLEYCPIGADKGAALHKLCALLDVPVSQTVAVGDERNDVSMLKAAQIGAAVQNASPAAKRAADYVTERNHNQGAVAEVIKAFLSV